MRNHLAKALHRVAAWVSSKSVAAPRISSGSAIDSYRRRREPTPPDLVRELRNAANACATINAAVCASFPPRLYVTTGAGLAPPKFSTRPLPRLQANAIAARIKAESVEEVTDHPILRLIAHPNSCHSGYDLLELTTLYLECRGIDHTLGSDSRQCSGRYLAHRHRGGCGGDMTDAAFRIDLEISFKVSPHLRTTTGMGMSEMVWCQRPVLLQPNNRQPSNSQHQDGGSRRWVEEV